MSTVSHAVDAKVL